MSTRHSTTTLPHRFSRALLACTLLPPGLLTADITTAAAQQPQPAATAADDFDPLNNLPQEAPQTFT